MGIESNSKRLIKNTFLLYFRTFTILVLNLYISRIILKVLGIEDFGIYNIVGGIVGMFTILSGSMTTATQRFIAFELGRLKNNSNSQNIFSATLTIHFLLAIIIFIIAESLGLWFLNEKLNIATERLYAANWIYQFSIITFIINIISIPYNALIVAHERMDAFAFISIIEVILKLFAVILLQYINCDKLIYYSLFILIISVIVRFLYGIFCKRSFENCEYRFFIISPLYKSLLRFTGWNFIGASSGVLSNQGINILMNLFFGVIPNAARGIAIQIDNALQSFVVNFSMALNPQITKSYASGDKTYTMKLVNQGGKFCFYLFLVLSIPILLYTPEILKLWLGNYPSYAVIFVRLSLVYILIQTLSQTLYILMLASGDIKKYQIVVGSISLLSFPLTWLSYKIGFPVETCYYVLIFTSVLSLIFRLIILPEKTGLQSWHYIKEVILPAILVCFIVSLILNYFISLGLNGLFLFFISPIITLILIIIIGINRKDRIFIIKCISKYINKFQKWF